MIRFSRVFYIVVLLLAAHVHTARAVPERVIFVSPPTLTSPFDPTTQSTHLVVPVGVRPTLGFSVGDLIDLFAGTNFFQFFVKVRWQITGPGGTVAVVEKQVQVHPPYTFVNVPGSSGSVKYMAVNLDLEWNGRSTPANGCLPDGAYQTSVVATLVQRLKLPLLALKEEIDHTAPHANPVTLQGASPTLTVTTPASIVVTQQSSLTVSGTVTGQAPLSLTINGSAVSLSGTSFSSAVAVPEGTSTITLVAQDCAGRSVQKTIQVLRDTVAPALTISSPADGSTLTSQLPQFQVVYSDTSAGVDLTSFQAVLDGTQNLTSQFQVTAAGATFQIPSSSPLPLGVHSLQVSVADVAGNSTTATSTFTVTAPEAPVNPPNPVERTVSTNAFDAAQFIYTGEHPQQTGVAPGTIEPKRAAVIRGRVLRNADGLPPVSGATVTVLGRPELGQSRSLADGSYNLVANGGGTLIIQIVKSGYLPVQRTLKSVDWQSWPVVPDVVLTALDPVVTQIDFTAPIEVARGSTVQDEGGPRRATLLFRQGTLASVERVDGTTSPLTSMHVRATEHTVGPNGLAAMPAELPVTTHYTYCATFTADEALSLDVRRINFSKPVIGYVENFIGTPTGTHIPSGSYDYAAGVWKAEKNGKAIKVLTVSGGQATLDLTGGGTPASEADLQALGIDQPELATIASLYSEGQSLWRVPLAHFSSHDWNHCYGTLGFPPILDFFLGEIPGVDDSCKRSGSIISVENQVLGENVSIVGTPFSLHYESDRVPGFLAWNSIRFPLIGPDVVTRPDRIEVETTIAGRTFKSVHAPTNGVEYSFSWDGKDAFGRHLGGTQEATVDVAYTFPSMWLEPEDCEEAWGRYPGSIGEFWPQLYLGYSRGEIPLHTKITRRLRYQDVGQQHFGNWTLNEHHAYDPFGHLLSQGDGTRRSVQGLRPALQTVAGTGEDTYSTLDMENTTATNVPIRTAGVQAAIAALPDGGYVFATRDSHIRKVDANGKYSTIVGTPDPDFYDFGFSGDGGPAVNALISIAASICVDKDGNIIFFDSFNNRIRKVDTNGIITTIAGGGSPADGIGDEGPATNAILGESGAIAIGPDGSIYFADGDYSVVRRIDPNGIIHRIAGIRDSNDGDGGDGGLATSAVINFPTSVAVGPDGSVYVANLLSIRKITPDGIIRTVAGTTTGTPFGKLKLGQPAVSDVWLGLTDFMSIAKDGTIYFSGRRYDIYEQEVGVILKVSPQGILDLVVGSPDGSQYSGEGQPGNGSQIGESSGFAMDPAGDLLIASARNHRVMKLSSPLPGYTGTDIAIPSSDGKAIFQFNNNGKHLRTLDALSGTTLLAFQYSPDGLLSTVTNTYGETTTIQRDASGHPTAIVAPSGKTTTLSVNGQGELVSVTNPAGDATTFTYGPGGLLATETDPRGGIHRFTYDLSGLLIKDEDPAGGYTTLTRSPVPGGYKVVTSSALGRTTTDTVVFTSDGGSLRTSTGPACSCSAQHVQVSADSTTTTTSPDGTRTTIGYGPDPRPGFGLQAPIQRKIMITLPSGLTMTGSMTRSVALTNPSDPLSVSSTVDQITINGHTTTSTYDRATRMVTVTSAVGRVVTATLDELGRVASQRLAAGENPIDSTYDAKGNVSLITQGGVSAAMTYDLDHSVASVTIAGNRTELEYSPAGSLSLIRLPDFSTVQLGHDPIDNLVQLIVPEGATHTFDHTPVNLRTHIAGPGQVAAVTTYDADRQPVVKTLPSGKQVTYSFDSGGRSTRSAYGAVSVTRSYTDGTNRVSTVTRTAGPGIAQALGYSYDGPLVTARTFNGLANGTYVLRHDNNFQVVGYTLDGGPEVGLSHDPDGLTIARGPFAITRNGPAGAVTRITDGTLQIDFTHDSSGRLATRTHTIAGTQVFRFELSYDTSGRIAGKTETAPDGTHVYAYGYDTRDRLVSVSRDGTLVEEYAYDRNGNRTRKLVYGSAPEIATYTAADRLVQRGGLAYAFDADGALSSRGGDVFHVSETGELTTATVGSSTIVYGYDGTRRRVSRTDAQGTTQYLYAGVDGHFQLTESRSPTGELTRYYHDEFGFLIAFERGGVRTYVATDQVGSPRTINDAGGPTLRTVAYSAFGEVLADSAPGMDLPVGFAGGLVDPATGLVRFGVRDYEPTSGRWIESDPIDFDGGLNLYAYANDNPVNLVDPLGTTVTTFPGLIGLIRGIKTLITLATLPARITPVGIAATALTGAIVWATFEISMASPRRPPPTKSRCLDAAEHPALWDEFCRSLPASLKKACWEKSGESIQKRKNFCNNYF